MESESRLGSCLRARRRRTRAVSAARRERAWTMAQPPLAA
jgi:hypothetical protein